MNVFISRRTSVSFERKTKWLALGSRTTRAEGTPLSNAFAWAEVDSRSLASAAARISALMGGNEFGSCGTAKIARQGTWISVYLCCPSRIAFAAASNGGWAWFGGGGGM